MLLSSVNLPGGELRRRSAEDELGMRRYLQEGDLISAEVQQIYQDGALSLHTRSLKYGKLAQGTLLQVPPNMVKRRKIHFHKFPFGVSVILGNNGFVWIYVNASSEEEENVGGFTQDLTQVDKADREAVCRMRNCVLALAENGVMLWDTSLAHAFEIAQKLSPNVGELVRPLVRAELAALTRQRLQIDN